MHATHEAFEYHVPKVNFSKDTIFPKTSDYYEVVSTSEECLEWVYDHDFNYISMTSEVGVLISTRDPSIRFAWLILCFFFRLIFLQQLLAQLGV